MTKLEILEETVKFYSEDVTRRSFVRRGTGTSCMYNSPEGKHCALGRCFTPEIKALGEEFLGNFDSPPHNLIKLHSVESFDTFLEEKYRGQPLDFWFELQILHDCMGYWGDKGLTKRGKLKVEEIKKGF